MRTVSRLENANVTVLTFLSAPDGNLQVVCSLTEKPYENTHAPFERPHAAQAAMFRERVIKAQPQAQRAPKVLMCTCTYAYSENLALKS